MNHDQHEDPAEQLRRAQARHDADRADAARYETLGTEDTQQIPVARPRHRRRWAIGAAVAAVLAAGIAVPALAAGGSEPVAGGQPAQVQPADAGTPTEAPSDAPTDSPSTAPGEAPEGGPAGPGACAAPPAPGQDAPRPPAPGGDAPRPPAPGADAPKPPAPGKDAPKPPTPGKDAPAPPAPPSGAPSSGS